jgi:hypothetical protein
MNWNTAGIKRGPYRTKNSYNPLRPRLSTATSHHVATPPRAFSDLQASSSLARIPLYGIPTVLLPSASCQLWDISRAVICLASLVAEQAAHADIDSTFPRLHEGMCIVASCLFQPSDSLHHGVVGCRLLTENATNMTKTAIQSLLLPGRTVGPCPL